MVRILQANVQCKMRNSRIQLTYTPEFLAAFESWTITLDDGSDIAYSISHDNRVGTSPKAGYYAFEENGAEFVTLNIRATTVTGNAVTFSQPYYKKDAESGYDENDGANFMGGDALLITLKPKAPGRTNEWYDRYRCYGECPFRQLGYGGEDRGE